MKLTITYKNGNNLVFPVNYLHFENNKIFFVEDKQVRSCVPFVVSVNLKNVKEYTIDN